MSRSFSTERCVPWLYSQAGVRVEGDPAPVAPAVEEVRARIPRRSAFGAKFAGMVGLFAAAISFMTVARPAQAAATVTTVRVATGAALSSLSVGAFALGRRLDRGAPALAVLMASGGVAIDDKRLVALAGDARKRLADQSWPDGHVWLISETPLSKEARAQASALQVRCFTPVNGRITEV